MFVLGALIGSLLFIVDLRSGATERRQRVMSDERAVGYRVALGETSPAIRLRDDSSSVH